MPACSVTTMQSGKLDAGLVRFFQRQSIDLRVLGTNGPGSNRRQLVDAGARLDLEGDGRGGILALYGEFAVRTFPPKP